MLLKRIFTMKKLLLLATLLILTACSNNKPITKSTHTEEFLVTTKTYKLPGRNASTGYQACLKEYGNQYRIADWIDIKNAYIKKDKATLHKQFVELGFKHKDNSEGKGLAVGRRGQELYSSSRHYYISYHNHNRPKHYLAHDNINNFEVSLGSWYGNYYILCKHK